MIYRFGPFRADRMGYRAFRGDEPLELTPKLLDLLFYLLDRPATLVTKEQLLDGVWPGANVTDNALAQAVSELREAIGDSASSPTYIRTVARRGYRFIAPVEVADTTIAPAAADRDVPPGPRAIAVLDFANVTGDGDVAWLSAGIAETVSSDLAALEHFRVIDRWRVLQATAEARGSMHDTGTALGVTLVATGSFQRSGSHLRISARIVDLDSGEALADAKVDGLVTDVFTLQDEVVRMLAREMEIAPPRQRRSGTGRETANLDAYRAHTEGWLKLEAFDTGLVESARRDFERAILADPRFAAAFTGLANAELVAYEMTRLLEEPDQAALASGIEHAQHAIRIEPELAEAHATLSFLLTSAGRVEEAYTAARRAVALDPDNWRHHYRLGHATWGGARERALERALALYPQFPYARLEMAMVYAARGQLDVVEALGRQGAAEQDRQARTGHRFPAVGFHWLLGALHAASGRHADAIVELDRELALADRGRLYAPEYSAASLFWRGHAELALERPNDALASFRTIHEHIPGQARAFLGEAVALAALGDGPGATSARSRARTSRARLEETGRHGEARLVAAMDAVHFGSADAAVRQLGAILDEPLRGPAGWTIPLEPALRRLQPVPGFAAVLDLLAERAG